MEVFPNPIDTQHAKTAGLDSADRDRRRRYWRARGDRRCTGHETTLTIEAKFNGKQHAVRGSLFADAISYQRIDRETIAGAAFQNGIDSIREQMTTIADTLTQSYMVSRDGVEIAKETAVFERM